MFFLIPLIGILVRLLQEGETNNTVHKLVLPESGSGPRMRRP
jgi:hypothetical protein